MTYNSELTMAVTSNHFSLYEAFKKEAEKLGWIYNDQFKPFKPHTSIHDCMYFSFNFTYMLGQPAFALSSTSEKTFQLESEFGQALQMAKQIIDSYSIKTVKLNDLYLADIDPKEKTVTVYEEQFGYPLGEQFSFDKIRELTDLINELELLEMDRFVNKSRKKC
jgi:hypothetical protein